jgi:hypothetical protein
MRSENMAKQKQSNEPTGKIKRRRTNFPRPDPSAENQPLRPVSVSTRRYSGHCHWLMIADLRSLGKLPKILL